MGGILLRRIDELDELEKLLHRLPSNARINQEALVSIKGQRLPIYSIVLGPGDLTSPAVAFFGGVHGLERIGTQVVISYLRAIAGALNWDEILHRALEGTRIAFYPLVNPGGLLLKQRSNPNGVDLMRNAPVDMTEARRFFLPGGHRISSALPWYRGRAGEEMEVEARALCQFVRRELFSASYSLALDVHSGFGLVDRLWFPHATTRRIFPRLPEVFALSDLLDQTLVNHIYRVEPQASSYIIHGDLWDFLYFEHEHSHRENVFLPFCLEMGSWLWVKKNPGQILTAAGLFNPVLPHRERRTLRRHLPLFDFLVRSTNSWGKWKPSDDTKRNLFRELAIEKWYTRTKYEN